MNTKRPEAEKVIASNISQRSYQALVWNYSGSAVSMSSQLIIGIVLARLLGPEAFGIVAIGMLMIGIGNLVVDFGFGAALIQGKSVTERDIGFVFSAQVTLGALLTLTGYIASSEIAIFFHHPDATPIIAAMSLLFFIQAFGQSAGAMLRRSLNFKAYQSINIASYLTGYVLVGIPCAVHGFGPWSLVAAQLVQSFMFSLVAMWLSRLPMRLTLKPESPGLFAFGGKVITTNLINWGISNFDSFAVGRFLGISDLGIYNRAMVLIAAPVNTLSGTLQGVLFAACSRAQTDTSQIRKAYFAASTMLGLLSLPFCLTVASVPGTVIAVIYGTKWAGAIPVFRPIALALAINALLSVIGPILTAQNKVMLELRAQVISLLVMLPVVYLTAQQSVTAVAWGVLFVSMVRWALLLQALSGSLDTTCWELLKPVRWPLICATITAGLTWTIDHLLQGMSPFSRLVGDVITAMLSLIFIFQFFGKKIMQGPHGDYLILHGRLPLLVQRWIGLYRG